MKKLVFLILAVSIVGGACAQNTVFQQDPRWEYHVPGKINSIVALNNTVIIGAENGVYMIDYGKTLRWFHPTGGSVTSIKDIEGKIVVASSDGFLRMLTVDGVLVWKRQIPGYVGYDDAVDVGEYGILCGSMDGFVYMFSLNGTYNWKRLVGSYVTKVHLMRNRVVAVSDRQVYILDPDGRVRLNLHISGYVRAATVADETIIVGMDDGVLYAYDINGETRWKYDVGEDISVIDGVDNITVGSRGMRLMHFTKKGELLWEVNMSEGVIAVESSREYILASTLDNKVHIYNNEGVIRWYYDTDGRATYMSIYDRNIVSGTTTGQVYYSKLPKRDIMTSFLISGAVIILVGAALLMISKSWR